MRPSERLLHQMHPFHPSEAWPVVQQRHAAVKKLKAPFPSPASQPQVPLQPRPPGQQVSKALSPLGDPRERTRPRLFRQHSRVCPAVPPPLCGMHKGTAGRGSGPRCTGALCKGGARAGTWASSEAQRQPSLCSLPQKYRALLRQAHRQSEPAPDHLVADSKGRDRSGRLCLQVLLNSQEQKRRMPEGPLHKRR